MSSKQCQVRVSYKRVKQECHARASNKKRCAIVSSKGVLQECHLSVSTQGVSQVGSLENVRNKCCLCSSTYVSAFGFVGFILFTFHIGDDMLQIVYVCVSWRMFSYNYSLSWRGSNELINLLFSNDPILQKNIWPIMTVTFGSKNGSQDFQTTNGGHPTGW